MALKYLEVRMMRRNWQRELRKNSNEVRGKLREWWSPFNWNVFTISYAQTVPIGFQFYISLLNYFATAGLNTYEVHTRLPNHLGFSWILLMRGIERRTESDLKKKKKGKAILLSFWGQLKQQWQYQQRNCAQWRKVTGSSCVNGSFQQFGITDFCISAHQQKYVSM